MTRNHLTTSRFATAFCLLGALSAAVPAIAAVSVSARRPQAAVTVLGAAPAEDGMAVNAESPWD